MKELKTTEEVARLLHMHPKRVQQLARSGRLPALRVGRRWLFPGDRLADAIDLSGAVGTQARAAPVSRAVVEPVPQNDELALEISARNQLRGRIVEIAFGGLMAEVRVDVGGQILASVITRSSAERMRLAVGDEVLAVVKATEVMLARG
jgi:molybdopterin-binding protein